MARKTIRQMKQDLLCYRCSGWLADKLEGYQKKEKGLTVPL